MRLDVALRDLQRAHVAMSAAVKAFTAEIGPVVCHQQDGIRRFDVTTRDARTIEVLMAARIVSGLDGTRALLERGFAWEIGVLLRAVEDFRLAISFLEDGLNSPQPTEAYRRFIETYFSQQMLSAEDWLKDSTKKWYPPARKKRAADVRLLQRFGDPDRIRRILEVEEEMLSGYVHGLYRQNMEMYRRAVRGRGEGFVVEGAPNSRRAVEMARQIATYTYRSFISFIAIAERLQLADVAKGLYREWKLFGVSEAYS